MHSLLWRRSFREEFSFRNPYFVLLPYSHAEKFREEGVEDYFSSLKLSDPREIWGWHICNEPWINMPLKSLCGSRKNIRAIICSSGHERRYSCSRCCYVVRRCLFTILLGNGLNVIIKHMYQNTELPLGTGKHVACGCMSNLFNSQKKEYRNILVLMFTAEILKKNKKN